MRENEAKQQLASNLKKGKLFCAECGQVIGIGDAVTHSDSTFHANCFCCVKCRAPLAETGFKDVNGEPHCPSCAGGTAGGFCAGCGKKLSGKFLSAMGQKWHAECFVCVSCKKQFQGGYAEKNGEPYCATCIQQKGNTTVVSQPSGDRKTGFTIDPRTGKKKFT